MTFYQIQHKNVLLYVQVKTNAKKTGFLGLKNGFLTIALRTAPVGGKANLELICFISEIFSIPKSKIQITRGEHAKKKTITLPLTLETKAIIKNLMGSEKLVC